MKKSMLFSAIAGLLITIYQPLQAQEERVAGKHFFAELGGGGVIMSVNFDARFMPNTRLGFGYRLGAGFGVGQFENPNAPDIHTEDYYYDETVTRTVYSFPIGLNYIFGKHDRAHTFEVGAGASILSRKMSLYNYDIEKEGHMIGFLTFMYRIAPVHSGITFRVGFTPIIGTAGDLFPMGAVSMGYAF